jgi:hypothetical protein
MLKAPGGTIFGAAFSPDGQSLATVGDDKIVRIWEVATGRLVRTMAGHTATIYTLAYSEDGRQLATGGSDMTVRLWDLTNGKLLRTLSGHTDYVYAVAFSPDGRILASGSRDNQIRLWDPASGQLAHTIVVDPAVKDWDAVWSLAFSPDGAQFASASSDKLIRLWPATGAITAGPPSASSPISRASPPPMATPPAGGQIDLQIVPNPPPGYYRDLAVPPAPGTKLRLKQVSAAPNKITDDTDWWDRNALEPIDYKPPNPFKPDAETDVPANVPRQFRSLILTRAIRSNPVLAFYGRDFSDAHIVLVINPSSGAVSRALDFSNYIMPYKFKEQDKDYVGMEMRWAVLEGNTLYFSYAHSTYAASSMGYNAYVAALDLASNRLLWQSQPLTGNAQNFLIKGDAIVTGYGFTAEPRYIYIVNKGDGRIANSLQIHNYPDFFVEKDGKLYVRTYDTDYVFQYVN